ncbi:MAG TPA: Rid family hydrolase, partial [Acidobacteriota bacterium]|nr:Rid family hydrolase [Acidobacteriota bacterium]
MKQEIRTDKAPKAIGPYSQGVVANGFVFVSGQIPFDPATGELVTGSIEDQARRALSNVAAVLNAAG